jgi:hypothetical protein
MNGGKSPGTARRSIPFRSHVGDRVAHRSQVMVQRPAIGRCVLDTGQHIKERSQGLRPRVQLGDRLLSGQRAARRLR